MQPTSKALDAINAQLAEDVPPMTYRQLNHWLSRTDRLGDRNSPGSGRRRKFTAQQAAAIASVHSTLHRIESGDFYRIMAGES